jgi:hypothetical protein
MGQQFGDSALNFGWFVPALAGLMAAAVRFKKTVLSL